MNNSRTLHWATGVGDAHDLLIRLISTHFGIEDSRISHACPECGSSTHGRPFLVGHPGLSVSVSRAADGTRVAVAASDVASVGIDIEARRSVLPADASGIIQHPREEYSSNGELLRAWVRKEAILKAEGTGLVRDPRDIHVDESGTVISGSRARCIDVDAGDAWVCALAQISREPRLRHRAGPEGAG